MRTKLAHSASFLLCLAGLSAQAAVYRNADPAFTLEYDDSTWAVAPPAVKGKNKEAVDMEMAEKTLVSLQRIKPDDKYHSRFSVVMDSLKKFKAKEGEDLLKAYTAHAVEFMKSQRFQTEDPKPISLPKLGVPAMEVQGYQRDFGLNFRQVLFIKNGNAFLVTGATRKAKADEQKAEISKILESLSFGDKT